MRLTAQKVEVIVNIDGLTQIANHRCFTDRLEKEWLRLCREYKPITLILSLDKTIEIPD
ncbi:diguanylate cyclase domain-containing protein [Pseudanabaena yagii]|uniref:Diguanylate cyclase n=1 Tax=Pseudanabaena yagii GIHE-NHR1 TaxID=2722753 RepID=A0ABX1LPF2_9CYAN|nr:diguanylate cyclase [Pseudanabaena yagii]NMF57193.1 diguanylate cyclase [Pseudanabaena yagii GIHE-NHR1]